MTGTTTNPATTAASFYRAMKSQDVHALLALMDEDIVIEIPGDSGIAGTFRGKESTLGLFGTLGELSEGTYGFDIQTIADTPGFATAVGRATASARGKDLDQEVVHVLDIQNGRVTSLRCFFGNQSMTDEFWS
jgi:uncharacterized protein